LRKARGRPKTPGGWPGGIDGLKIEAFLVSHDPRASPTRQMWNFWC